MPFILLAGGGHAQDRLDGPAHAAELVLELLPNQAPGRQPGQRIMRAW
jgi:hypothetical protein